MTGNRLLYRDGIPIALLAGGEVQFLETLDAGTEWEARKALLRRTASPPLAQISAHDVPPQIAAGAALRRQ